MESKEPSVIERSLRFADWALCSLWPFDSVKLQMNSSVRQHRGADNGSYYYILLIICNYIFTTANLFISFCIKNLLEKVAASSTHCNARWRSLWRIFIKFRSAQSASDYQWHWSSDRENRRHFFDQFDKQIIIWNNYFNLLRFTAKEN